MTATTPKTSRVLLWTLVLLGLAVAFALLMAYRSRIPAIASACEPLPSNIEKLSGALTPQAAVAALDSYGQDGAALESVMRPGDEVHEFETAVTGGHLVLRDKCYIGQSISWIR